MTTRQEPPSAAGSAAHQLIEPPAPNAPRPSGPARVVAQVLGGLGVVLALNQVFLLNLFGFQPLGNGYLYYLIGIFLSVAFICLPARKADAIAPRWYDWLLVVAILLATLYLGYHGLDIIQQGWEYEAPLPADIATGVVILAALEGIRRAAGPILLGTALFFGCYPLFADFMPGFLWGTAYGPLEAARAHVLGVESIIGIPMTVVGELVIGFVIFGSVRRLLEGRNSLWILLRHCSAALVADLRRWRCWEAASSARCPAV
jgi:TRAP-type uncharacterized transport system fused permease subunit